MIPRTAYEINKEVWFNPGDKCLVREKGHVSEYKVVDCLWSTVILTNGKYNFCVQKVDLYYRLDIIRRD